MKLIIVRGPSGFGKTTYAKTFGLPYFEADMFFEKNGEYKFDASRIAGAHIWCQHNVEVELREGNDVVVSNTFTKRWEIQPYLDFAKKYGAEVEIYRMTKEYGNIHGVPQDKVEQMKARMEDFEGEKLVS